MAKRICANWLRRPKMNILLQKRKFGIAHFHLTTFYLNKNTFAFASALCLGCPVPGCSLPRSHFNRLSLECTTATKRMHYSNSLVFITHRCRCRLFQVNAQPFNVKCNRYGLQLRIQYRDSWSTQMHFPTFRRFVDAMHVTPPFEATNFSRRRFSIFVLFFFPPKFTFLTWIVRTRWGWNYSAKLIFRIFCIRKRFGWCAIACAMLASTRKHQVIQLLIVVQSSMHNGTNFPFDDIIYRGQPTHQ